MAFADGRRRAHPKRQPGASATCRRPTGPAGPGLTSACRKCVPDALAVADPRNTGIGAKLNARSPSPVRPRSFLRHPVCRRLPHERARGLIHAEHQDLQHSADPKIEQAGFLAWTQAGLEICQAALRRPGLKPAGAPPRGVGGGWKALTQDLFFLGGEPLVVQFAGAASHTSCGVYEY